MLHKASHITSPFLGTTLTSWALKRQQEHRVIKTKHTTIYATSVFSGKCIGPHCEHGLSAARGSALGHTVSTA